MVEFLELKEGTEYEVHVNAKHYYIGMFKKYVDDLAYFENVKAVFPEVTMPYFQGQYFDNSRVYSTVSVK
jgi:hypothetical protein